MLTTILMIVIAVGGLSSSKCSTDWKAPEIHGIRLGMTVNQVRFRLPFLRIPPADKYNVRETFLYVTTNRREQKRLPRVFALEMWFWKDRLVRYNLKYYGSESSDGVARFTKAVETQFNLSDANRVSAHRYQCGNVTMSVAEDLKRTVSLRDVEGEKVLNRRVDESYGLKP